MRAARASGAFFTFHAFLFAIYKLIRPGLSGAPDVVLPAMLSELEGRLARLPTRTAVLDELQSIIATISFLRSTWFSSADDVDKNIMRFLERVIMSSLQVEIN